MPTEFTIPDFDVDNEVKHLCDYIVATWENTSCKLVQPAIKAAFDAGWFTAELDNKVNMFALCERREHYLRTEHAATTDWHDDSLLVALKQLTTVNLDPNQLRHRYLTGGKRWELLEEVQQLSLALRAQTPGLMAMAPLGYHAYMESDVAPPEPSAYTGEHDHLFNGMKLQIGTEPNFRTATCLRDVILRYEGFRQVPLTSLLNATYLHAMRIRRELNTPVLQAAVDAIDIEQSFCGGNKTIFMPDVPIFRRLLDKGRDSFSSLNNVLHDAQWVQPGTVRADNTAYTYPELDDYQWMQEFPTADAVRKMEIAQLWCQAFEATAANLSPTYRLKTLVPHYRWLRLIKAHVDNTSMSGNSPFKVFDNYVNLSTSAVRDAYKYKLVDLVESMWFDKQGNRESAMRTLSGMLGKLDEKNNRLPHDILNLVHDLAWDIIQANPNAHALTISSAVNITISRASRALPAPTASADPRTLAWHELTRAVLANDKIFSHTHGVDVQATIRAMPATAVANAVMRLVTKISKPNGGGNRIFQQGTILGPDAYTPPHVFDIMRHWIPSKNGLWESAQALGLTPQHALQQVYSELKQPGAKDADLPGDFVM